MDSLEIQYRIQNVYYCHNVPYMFKKATFGFSPPLIYRTWPQKTIPLLNNTTRGKLWVTRGSYAVPFLYFVLFSCLCVPHSLGVHMRILLLHEVISSFPPTKVSFYLCTQVCNLCRPLSHTIPDPNELWMHQ